jgi:copper chaperone NosL
MKKLKPISRILIVLSALLMISAYFVPLWQILMWAPQYPEGLEMKIWIDNITGDVKIISALNHYIGMKHIEVSMFPEFSYMIYLVGILIAAGLITALVNRKFLLIAYSSLVIIAGIAALTDFYLWGYDYGHNLDPTAPIIVPGMSYQPPVIGTKQLLNFTAFSGPDTGGWIFLVSGLLAVGALILEMIRPKKEMKIASGTTVAFLTIASIVLGSCSVTPEPLAYGKDNCHACKMTLMDEKFGGEIVTKKGKIYKFDDANCMLNFIKEGSIVEQDIEHILVADFASPKRLINARTASFVRSEKIKSPMAGNVAAFEDKKTLEQFNQEWNGSVLSWNELETALAHH